MVSMYQTLKSFIPFSDFGSVHEFPRIVTDVFNSFGTAVEAVQEYERLTRCSNRQLAAMGISRETLPQHIFANYLDR